MLKYFLSIWCCFFSLVAAAQISGRVTDAATRQPLYPVTVVNLSTQQKVYTNEQGRFSLPAQAGQQVVFSYVGYRVVTHLLKFDEGDLTIKMEPLKVQLQDLIVRPYDYTPYQLDSLERRATHKRSLARQKSSPLSPFSFVAERLSKKSKRIFKFQESFAYWEDQRFIDTRYTPDLVYEMTGLDDDSLAHFMNATPMPYDFARTASDLELKMWIRSRFKQWRKNPVIPQISADSALIGR